jgi:hypothetical protein
MFDYNLNATVPTVYLLSQLISRDWSPANWTISRPREETQQLRGFVRLHFNLLRVEGDGALRQLASHRWRRAIRESIVSR